MKLSSISRSGIAILGMCLVGFTATHRVVAQGAVEMEFIDDSNGEPVSARITFTKPAKKGIRPKSLLYSGDHWLAEKKFPLSLPTGEYEFFVQRGPEFKAIRGGFTIEPRAKDVVSVAIPRTVEMHTEHWYSGDHLSSLPIGTLSRWQQADAVDLVVSTAEPADVPAPALSPAKASKTKERVEEGAIKESELVGLKLNTSSQWLDWQHGSILLHGVPVSSPSSPNPLAKGTPTTNASTAFQLLSKAKESEGVVLELVRLWDRDVPILLGNESIRSVQFLSTSNRPNGDDRITFSSERGNRTLQGKVQISRGKERVASEIFAPIPVDDELKFKDARGVGRLSEFLYWQMLEAGLRLTPTAGSDFAFNDTHLGYNRVYIFSEEEPTKSTWWHAITKGRTMVTNGPLLRASVNALPPGSVQASYRGQPIPLDIVVLLSVRDPVDYLDVIFNGETIYSAKLEDHYKRGEFPTLEIEQSGWLVIRVVTANEKGYRLATTAPFYFEFDGKPRVSRRAVTFFERWLAKSKAAITLSNELEQLAPRIAQAEEYWTSRRELSNTE